MGRIKVPYQEGTLFGVPLEDKSFGVGLVARSGKSGKILLGYFFGRKCTSIPDVDNLQNLTHADALLACMLGDLGLIKGWWSIVCHMEDFSRREWPMPMFSRIDPYSGKETLVRYAEDDPAEEIELLSRPAGDTSIYPEDGLNGYEAVQIQLSRLLGADQTK